MKLGDIKLTDEQAAAFVRWLDDLVAEQSAEDVQEQQEAERDRQLNEWAKELESAAATTAQLHGPLVGVRAIDQARAAWVAFAEGEGYFGLSDIAEHFDPHAHDLFPRVWEDAYTEVIHRLRREQSGMRSTPSA